MISYRLSFQGGPIINNLFSFIIFYIQYAIILIQLIISLFSDHAVFETDDARRHSKFDERSPLLGSSEIRNFENSAYKKVI